MIQGRNKIKNKLGEIKMSWDFKKIIEAVEYLKSKNKRKKQLERNIPDIWKYKTVLYIGARKYRRDFTNQFKQNEYKIDILEIFDKNIQSLKKLKFINKLIKGDVREIDKLVNNKYDVVFWWHGPEHIQKRELKPTLNKLKKLTNHVLVCGCPYGKYEQGAVYGNPWEKHLSYLEPRDFKKSSFKVEVLGKKDSLGSNILAWWRRQK